MIFLYLPEFHRFFWSCKCYSYSLTDLAHLVTISFNWFEVLNTEVVVGNGENMNVDVDSNPIAVSKVSLYSKK